MAKSVEFNCVEDLVNHSEKVSQVVEQERSFEYNLSDKNAKAKLLKGAKRIPFELVKKTSSINLVFNLGSWNNVVLPSINY